jgi:hypothetical protein
MTLNMTQPNMTGGKKLIQDVGKNSARKSRFSKKKMKISINHIKTSVEISTNRLDKEETMLAIKGKVDALSHSDKEIIKNSWT